MMGESRQRRSESHYEVYVRHKYLYLCYAELMHGVEKSMAVEKNRLALSLFANNNFRI